MCSEEHELCAGNNSTVLPTRILDVSPTGTEAELVLVETNGQSAPYAALSHCWGKKQIITTKLNTIDQWKKEIPMNLLSNTFRDAVQLCRRLEIRYLWIDSLCIIQDSVDDWVAESAKMASVYGDSYLVIAATRSSDGEGGCYSERMRSHEILPGPGTSQEYAVISRPELEHVPWKSGMIEYLDRVGEFPLLSRCWCYQEQLLGRRVLHFAKEEMIWDCMTGITCECGKLENAFSIKKSYSEVLARAAKPDTLETSKTELKDEEIYEMWQDLVYEYTIKQLTMRSDVLPAISGVARQIWRPSLGRYLAGVWENALPRSLLWYSRPSDNMYLPDTWNQRTKEYLAPSWSWTSVIGPVAFDVAQMATVIKQTSVEVLRATYSPKYSDEFGPVEDASLVLRAPVVLAKFAMKEYSTASGIRRVPVGHNGDIPVRFHLDSEQDHQDSVGKPVLFVRLLTFEKKSIGSWFRYSNETPHQPTRGLVLVPSMKDSTKYKRIGMFEYSPDEFWASQQSMELEIV
jgi:hypothetical protein